MIADKARGRHWRARRGDSLPAPRRGLAVDKFTDAQRTTLRNLIQAYLDNMTLDVAAARQAEIEKAGFDKIHFAWAGASQPGIGHYYRVQGPTFLIEFVNTQPDSAGNPANHIHAVWRIWRAISRSALRSPR